jgi:hypothetical protein
MASIISSSPSMPQEQHGTSTAQHTAVGSGSRPTKSKHEIQSSAPTDPWTLDRGVKGALPAGNMKGGKSGEPGA